MPLRYGIHCLLLSVFLSALACTSSSSTETEATKWIEQGALLVDVRSTSEFASGSLPGALHIPHDEASARITEFGRKDQPIVVFCARGGRAARVKSLLESQGWTQVHNGGGIDDLR